VGEVLAKTSNFEKIVDLMLISSINDFFDRIPGYKPINLLQKNSLLIRCRHKILKNLSQFFQ